METVLPIHLQEVLFSTGDKKLGREIAQLKSEGKIRKIAPRVYSPNLVESPEIIIRRNLFAILGHLYPKALLSHRSALEFKPTSAGHLFLTYTYTKKVKLPGIVLRFLEGPGPIPGDNPLSGELFVSQTERALLENMESSRQPRSESKTLTLPEIEERLEQVIRVKGEAALNELRDTARGIAEQLNMKKEFDKLNKLIGALLNTQPTQAVARAFGNPYDPARLSLFEKLFVELKQHEFKDQPDKNTSLAAFRNFAFFESYFSNYIEGTEFALDEAKRIIETGTPIPDRDEDSHDILGTYKLVSNRQEMTIVPGTSQELLKILLYRHLVLLGARQSKKPGQFKDKNNRAGETHFVDQLLVKGTLMKGFDFYQALVHPFARAIYIMFLISEVHPFLDGNGRVARVMLNADLVKKGQTKIIIPTVFREDYLAALRKFTRQGDPAPYIRMMAKAQEFSATLAGDDINEMEIQLKASNAFKEPDKAKLKII